MLRFETNNEKFNLGSDSTLRGKSKKTCGHSGGNLLQSSLEVGGTLVKDTRM